MLGSSLCGSTELITISTPPPSGESRASFCFGGDILGGSTGFRAIVCAIAWQICVDGGDQPMSSRMVCSIGIYV